MVNADKPAQWKADMAASVDHYNAWFMKFAPRTYREKRLEVTTQVEDALLKSSDLTDMNVTTLHNYPGILPVLRMCCCPPLARERLAGLAGVNKTLIEKLEEGSIPPRTKAATLESNLGQVVKVLSDLLDVELFPWLGRGTRPGREERHRASTIVADRLCGSMSDPIIRNAQEKRQLDLIGAYLRKKRLQTEAQLCTFIRYRHDEPGRWRDDRDARWASFQLCAKPRSPIPRTSCLQRWNQARSHLE